MSEFIFFYGTLTAFFSLVPAAPNPPKPPKAPPLVSPFFAAAAFSAISLLNAIRVSLVYSSFLQESNNRPQWCVIHQWLHCLPMCCPFYDWATSHKNMSSGIFDQVRFDWQDSNQPAQLQKLARILNLDIASIHIILSKQWTIKVLIRLQGCADWSVPLLFAYGIRPAKQCCKVPDIHYIYWNLNKLSHVTRKPVYGVCNQVRLKLASSATEAS